jgi:cadmium resistance transport/sequestration family protein
MEIALASIIAFVTTNIDDIFILTLFFGHRKFKDRNIILGQYLGIIFLTAVGFTGSLIGLVINLQYVGLLGLAPIYLGIKGLIDLQHRGDEQNNLDTESISTKSHYSQIISIASVTIANGADNISVYIPLFATLVLVEKIIMTFVFLVMTGIWCYTARYLTTHERIKKTLEKYGESIIPFVFILLGIYLLKESGTITLLYSLF